MVIHLVHVLRRGSCGLPPRPFGRRPYPQTLCFAKRSIGGVGTFGLAPRRDCRVSHPRAPRGGGRLTVHDSRYTVNRTPFTPLRSNGCSSLWLSRRNTWRAPRWGNPPPAFQREGPEVIGVRCLMELGLSSPIPAFPQDLGAGRHGGDHPAALWLTVLKEHASRPGSPIGRPGCSAPAGCAQSKTLESPALDVSPDHRGCATGRP